VEEHYATEDEILPELELSKPCEIRIDVDEKYVRLHVGQRDWEWPRGCPDISSTGTFVNQEE
jgi:hypothetical protein